ncbi:MAG: hypothetical protein ACT4QC_09900 [Planctomycetaceae bacterium]
MKPSAAWAPFWFCVALSIITLTLGISMSGEMGWAVAFLCFLPMCFFFVANQTSQMQRELNNLRQRITEFEQAERTNGI